MTVTLNCRLVLSVFQQAGRRIESSLKARLFGQGGVGEGPLLFFRCVFVLLGNRLCRVI